MTSTEQNLGTYMILSFFNLMLNLNKNSLISWTTLSLSSGHPGKKKKKRLPEKLLISFSYMDNSSLVEVTSSFEDSWKSVNYLVSL